MNLFSNIILPKWVANKSILVYFIVLLVVYVAFFDYYMPWYFVLSGSLSVITFFYYGNKLTRKLGNNTINKNQKFEKKIFWISFIIRVIWVCIIYIIFQNVYGDAFGFENADASYYDDLARFIASLIEHGNYDFYNEIERFNGGKADISDMGYGFYLSIIYMLFNNSIIVARLVKCIWSSLTVVIIYRLTSRNFGNNVGVLAAVMCVLWPNFWYYCGVHLKEVEMTFLSVLFVEQTDKMLRTQKFSVWRIIPLLLILAAIFTLRTALALVAVLSLLFSITLVSSKVINWGKRIIIALLTISMIGVTYGNFIYEKATELTEVVQSGNQKNNMEWRSRRVDGNSFAKYAGVAVFAPLILTIPFPSMVKPFDGQELQQMLNGGNFIKNIFSFFTIFSLFFLLLNGQWRNHSIVVSFLVGYLIVLAFSEFAQSERFHQPAMPFEFMFAAYGISQVLKGVPVYKNIGSRIKYKKWFNMWCVLMLVAAVAWNWFKLAGRGLI